MPALYDVIGSSYAASRRADPVLVGLLADYVALAPSGSYLDLACGTGNYTVALSAIGGRWTGLDISNKMLEQARQKSQAITWLQSDAADLPFQAGVFDGAICTLALHHFKNLAGPFAEVRRIIRSGSFVIFTGLPEQMKHYWLGHYFPQMMARSIKNMPEESTIREALSCAGFGSVDLFPFFVTPELQDLFLYAGKDRPGLYLDAVVRSNISSFATLTSSAELQSGLARLAEDLQSGAFHDVRAQHRTADGDYAFILARSDA